MSLQRVARSGCPRRVTNRTQITLGRGRDRAPRAIALLESALAAPRATFGGGLLHPSLPEMAAAYLFHIVRNHPFVDGNKRAGLATAIAFLGLNDLWLEADEDELAELVTAVAEGRIGKPEIAVFVKEHAERFG